VDCGARLVLGIDPGKTGSAALVRCRPGVERPKVEHVWEVKALLAIGDAAARADLVVIEQQQASPQMGRTSAFELGMITGCIEGLVLARTSADIVRPMPAAWRGSFGLGGGKAGKARGVEMARVLAGTGIERHDQADAILLAWWGWKRILEPALVSAHETHTDW
jgi:Holliday junction resolvasome RuvABC endonuclease subunit